MFYFIRCVFFLVTTSAGNNRFSSVSNASNSGSSLGTGHVREVLVDDSFARDSSADKRLANSLSYGDSAVSDTSRTMHAASACAKCKERRCDGSRPTSLALPRNGHLPNDLAKLAGGSSSSCECCAVGHIQRGMTNSLSNRRQITSSASSAAQNALRSNPLRTTQSLTRVAPPSTQAPSLLPPDNSLLGRSSATLGAADEKYRSSPSLVRPEQTVTGPGAWRPTQNVQRQQMQPQSQPQQQEVMSGKDQESPMPERRHSVDSSEMLSAYHESKDFGSNASTLQSSSGGNVRGNETDGGALNREDTPQAGA